MRLFTGIDLPAEVKQNLADLTARLRPAARLKWSSAGSFHVTTKFIGGWPETRLSELVSVLRSLPAREPIPISVRGLGWFPNAKAPRVFWAGIEAPPALAELAKQTDQATSKLGISRENRPFSPHLTLARIKDQTPLECLQREIGTFQSDDFGEFTADRFHLYLSELSPSGSIYTKLEEFLFAGS